MPMLETAGVVVDTHVWLWIMNGDPIAPAAQEAVLAAASRGAVMVPAISAWEVGMLAEKGRISLSKPTLQWVQSALAVPGFRLADLSPSIAVESCQLPGNFHGDPADRMIVATARVHGVTLVSRDERILAYSQAGHVKVVKA